MPPSRHIPSHSRMYVHSTAAPKASHEFDDLLDETEPVYNSKKSFFDNLSSDITDRIRQAETGQRYIYCPAHSLVSPYFRFVHFLGCVGGVLTDTELHCAS